MKKTKFFKPYTSAGDKTNLSKFVNKSGVYIIKEKGVLIYVGFSGSNLYKTITRHFQTWNDKRQQRFVYNRNECTIRVVTTTPRQAAILEEALIRKHRPKDNKLKLELFNEREVSRALESYNNADEDPPF